MVKMNKCIDGEVNFLTEFSNLGGGTIQTIKTEFDFIQMCQNMMKPFGIQARDILDRYIALALRKLFCDKNSLLIQECEDFRMPPLCGHKFECAGEDNEMRIVEIYPVIHIKRIEEWVPVNEWLNEKIAWIDKGVDEIPEEYGEIFFQEIVTKLEDRRQEFLCYFDWEEGKKPNVWRLKNPNENRLKVYSILKDKGYYDLTIKRLIKHIADKQGAHLDRKRSLWISMANQGKEMGYSAMSTFATHMIYASTKQIKALKDYYVIEPNIETL